MVKYVKTREFLLLMFSLNSATYHVQDKLNVLDINCIDILARLQFGYYKCKNIDK